jgi:PAS domain S-box-containing protein
MDTLAGCKELLDGIQNVLIWESDADAKFTYINESARTMVGYPLERWLGGPDVWTSLLHPEDQKWVKQLCLEETKKHHSYHCEFRFITSEGRVLWVRKYAYLRTGQDGASGGMRGVMIDITDEKRIAENLIQNEARYRIAMRSTRSLIWELDLATNELISTEAIAELFAFSADKMRSDVYFWYDNIHPDDRERVVMGIHSKIDSGEEFWEDEYRLRTGAGSYVYVLSRGRIIRDEHGKPLRMIGATTDVTQRKKMEQERYLLQRQEKQALVLSEQALRSQDEVMSVISHDLKNPLSSILMNVLLAQRNIGDEGSPKRVTECVARIYQAALRMKVLLDDLVDLARTEVGMLKIEADSVSVADLTKGVVDEAKKMFAGVRQTKLEVEILNHGTSVMADRERIQQTILKALRYLAYHGPEGATLKFRTGMLEDQVIFRFIHPDLILDRETLTHLFERSGSEMDLAIVRGVVLAHGGRVWANSTPDAGTSIYFTLNTGVPYSFEKVA